MNHFILISFALIFLSLGTTHGFGGLTNTKCNLDVNRGEVTDPCGGLYDAVCGGRYCRCPSGWIEHANLHRCVRDSSGGSQDGGSDLFDDLPFDYVPPNKQKDLALEETACIASHTCDTMYNAVCRNGFCTCPSGTIETYGKCNSVNTRDRNDRTIFTINNANVHTSGVCQTALFVLLATVVNLH